MAGNPFGEVKLHQGRKTESALRLDVELEGEREEIKDNWRCCLFKHKTDSRMIKYICQMGIIVGMMSASVVLIAKSDDCEDQSLWLGVLMMLLGYILEAPKIK